MKTKKIIRSLGGLFIGISAGLTIAETFKSFWAVVVAAVLIVGLILTSISENE